MQGGIGYLSMDYSKFDTFGQWTATFQPQTKVVVFRFKCLPDFLKYKKETRRKYLGGYMDGDDQEGRLMESLENFSEFFSAKIWINLYFRNRGGGVRGGGEKFFFSLKFLFKIIFWNFIFGDWDFIFGDRDLPPHYRP
jgi:hypothetical protein